MNGDPATAAYGGGGMGGPGGGGGFAVDSNS